MTAPRADRAAELRELADVWPEVARHVRTSVWEAVVDFEARGMRFSLADFEEKFRRGEAEHRRDWLEQPLEWFGDAIGEEILDAVLYVAMRRARFAPNGPDTARAAAPFVANRDLGDEQEPER